MFYILALIGIVGLLIFVHEFGHFTAARLLRIEVREFVLGFGPKLLKFQRGETVYGVAALPLGGYVRFVEAPPQGDLPATAFDAAPVWKRLVVGVAGPAMNLVLAIVVFAAIYAMYPLKATTTLEKVQTGSPAAAAGLKPGDVITSVGGKTTATWESVVAAISGSPGRKLQLTIERGERTLRVAAIPRKSDGHGVLGVQSRTVSEPLPAAFVHGTSTSYRMLGLMAGLLGDLVTSPGTTVRELAGPVFIVGAGAQALSQGALNYLNFLAFISLNLVIVNLLPLPPLDGGRIVILVIEGLSRRRPNQQVVAAVQALGIALLLLLMVYLVFSDIGRLTGAARL